MIDTDKKYGLKLTVIGSADYANYKEVCDAIVALGYSATIVDNGNMVFVK